MQVSSIVVPLLRFYFHEEVRIGAVQILCELLRSADLAAEKGQHGATKANVKQLLDYIWPALMEAISKVASFQSFLSCIASKPSQIQGKSQVPKTLPEAHVPALLPLLAELSSKQSTAPSKW